MKPIGIDFAPHSIKRAVRRAKRSTWLLATAGTVLCASAAFSTVKLIHLQDAKGAQLERVQTQLARRVSMRPVPKKIVISEAQAVAVNNAIEQLNLPWRDVLDAIEAATPSTVALLAIEPDAKKHLVKGMAETKASDGMIAYIEQLKRQQFFNAVVLTRHEINEQDPNKPLRFQFEAQWLERSP